MSNFYTLFGGENPPWINNQGGDWLLNSSNTPSFEVQCPLCNEHFHVMNIPIHISEAHPITYQFWLYTMMPSAYFNYLNQNEQETNTLEETNEEENNNDNSIVDYFSQLIRSIDTDTDTMSYDQLLSLCDSIGYHQVGYTNVEKEELCEPCERPSSDQYPVCTICLTEFSEIDSQTPISRLKKCQHVFCESCIYQWLDTHKKCPVCNQIQKEEE